MCVHTTSGKSMRWRRPAAILGVAHGVLTSSVVLASETARQEGAGIPTFQVVLQIGTVLALIVVLIIGATWLLRGIGRFNRSADGVLSVVSVLPLGTRERIVLLQAGRRQLLLGVAPGRVSTLHIFEEGVETGIGDRADGMRARPFASLLSRLPKHRSDRAMITPAKSG